MPQCYPYKFSRSSFDELSRSYHEALRHVKSETALYSTFCISLLSIGVSRSYEGITNTVSNKGRSNSAKSDLFRSLTATACESWSILADVSCSDEKNGKMRVAILVGIAEFLCVIALDGSKRLPVALKFVSGKYQ